MPAVLFDWSLPDSSTIIALDGHVWVRVLTPPMAHQRLPQGHVLFLHIFIIVISIIITKHVNHCEKKKLYPGTHPRQCSRIADLGLQEWEVEVAPWHHEPHLPFGNWSARPCVDGDAGDDGVDGDDGDDGGDGDGDDGVDGVDGDVGDDDGDDGVDVDDGDDGVDGNYQLPQKLNFAQLLNFANYSTSPNYSTSQIPPTPRCQLLTFFNVY